MKAKCSKPKIYFATTLLLLSLLSVAMTGCNKAFISYETLDYARETGRRVQVQGRKVDRGHFDPSQMRFEFRISDNNEEEIDVVYNGTKPNGFDSTNVVVVVGKVEDGRFIADDILTKCPSKYEENKNK